MHPVFFCVSKEERGGEEGEGRRGRDRDEF